MASGIPNIDDMTAQALGAKFTVAAVLRTLSTTTARSAQLPPGRYRIVSDAAVFLRQGGVAVDATTSDTLLPANTIDYIAVTGVDDDYVSGILAADTGTLYMTLQKDA